MTVKQATVLSEANQQLTKFAKVVNGNKPIRQVKPNERLRTGIDLGTSSIVLTVLDENNRPLYGAFEYDHAVRDGIIVNFIESVQILKRLKEKAEHALGVELKTACGAVPPGTGEGSSRIVTNVIEAAEFICQRVVDEPTAAAKFLRLQTGTVVDIGGGTTGISTFKDGQLVEVLDEPTGGFHMSLVLAGSRHIDPDKAELIKRDPAMESEVFAVIRPVVEKMATITRTMVKTEIPLPVIVVGGAINFKDFIPTFSKSLKLPAEKPVYPQFVTPLGIAMYDEETSSN